MQCKIFQLHFMPARHNAQELSMYLYTYVSWYECNVAGVVAAVVLLVLLLFSLLFHSGVC